MSKNNEAFNVGLIWPGDGPSVTIMQDAEGNFLNKEKDIKDWAHCLNNPWSDTFMEYEIHPNYNKAGLVRKLLYMIISMLVLLHVVLHQRKR